MNRLWRLCSVWGLALWMAACASLPGALKPGMSRDEVLAALGRPTAVHPLPQGERLQYSQQPSGRHVLNVDLGPDGKLLSVVDAMSAAVRDSVEVGVWTQSQVLMTFGLPAEVGRVASFEGDIWTWRYQESPGVVRFFHLYFDGLGIVRRVQSTDEYLDDRRLRVLDRRLDRWLDGKQSHSSALPQGDALVWGV